MESEIERLRKKVENFPSASLYTRLAELLRQAGGSSEAEAICRRCIKDFPRSGQAYVILAELQVQQGRKHEARQLLQLAVEKEPRSYTAQRLLADLCENKDEALEHLNAILSFKPGDPSTVQRITELGGTPPAPGTRSFRTPAPPPNPMTTRFSGGSGGATGTAGSSSAARPMNPPPGSSSAARPPIGTHSSSGRLTPVSPSTSGARPAAPTSPPAAGTPPAAGGATRDHIIPFPDSAGASPVPTSRPPARSTMPTSGPGGGASGLRRSRSSALDALCGEPGVRGAVLADGQGRVLASARLDAGRDELLAAMSLELGRSAAQAQLAAGNPAPAAWVLQANKGQVITFTRDKGVTILVVADPGVRPAMLELRARQVLVDLGGTL